MTVFTMPHYNVRVLFGGEDISLAVKSVNYSVGIEDLPNRGGRIIKASVYKGTVLLKEKHEISNMLVFLADIANAPFDVEIYLSEGKWWFLPEFSYKGKGRLENKNEIDIIGMHWGITRDHNSILAHSLRWLWRLFR